MIQRGSLGLDAIYTRSLSLPSSAFFVPSRSFSATTLCRSETAPAATSKLNPRWLSDTKTRLGKCILFGMNEAQINRAGTLLADVSLNWRSLVAGSEGYLIDPRRAGITSVPVDWGHQDSMGHVNNVQYVRYAESGRTNWTRQIGEHFDRPNKRQWDELLTNKNYGLILRSISIDFKFPMMWPDRISVYHKLRSMPTERDSSMLLDVMILSEGKQRVAAKCQEDVVVYNYRAGKKSTLPEFMLVQFQKQFEEQEVAKQTNSARVNAILDEVTALEKETWDRPDAKEDMGGT